MLLRFARGFAASAWLVVTLATSSTQAEANRPLWPQPESMERARPHRGIRGITVGPIESALHPGKGYGSPASAETMREARRLGAGWVSLTPFGRVWDLQSTGVDWTFEAPYEKAESGIRTAIRQAHREGLRVMLVPHLWVESGGWRAEIDPQDDTGWRAWTESYRRFLLAWAKLAEEEHVDLLSVGVELRSWVTTTRAPSFVELIREVRTVYSGPLTYAANWDDVERTVVLGELDLIGINAFYPLTDRPGASLAELLEGGRRIAREVSRLAKRWNKPVLFTEIGYTTRPDPALRPWEWPDSMTDVVVDQRAQAEAYFALLAPLLGVPEFAGFFVWRVYADPNDMSQEAEWGFSPRGKLAEAVIRDALSHRWAADPSVPYTLPLQRPDPRIGLY